MTISPPGPGEYGGFYEGYVNLVCGTPNIVDTLERQLMTLQVLKNLDERHAGLRYAEGKWSVKQVLGHMADAERIFGYRLLRVARADETPLPGFDENSFVEHAGFDSRSIAGLADELAIVRQGTLMLIRGLDDTALLRRATINNTPATARALIYIVAGHFAHHVRILRDRYGIENL